MEVFEQQLKRNLYRLWNRMASGPYFPPPIREVTIPKRDGGDTGSTVNGLVSTNVDEASSVWAAPGLADWTGRVLCVHTHDAHGDV